MKRILSVFLLSIIFFSCQKKIYRSAQPTQQTKITEQKKPKYVFFFIGDGFGVGQAHLAECYLAAMDGEVGIRKLTMNEFPVHGTYTTFAENRFITCSAAGGTAMATGKKTSINTISMNSEHTINFETIAERAHKQGMKTGIVTTVSIDHATPAVFYAHQPHRDDFYDIAKQLPKSSFNYFGGGGFMRPNGYFESEEKSTLANIGLDNASGGKVKQQHNIYNLFKELNYQFINTIDGFNQLTNGDDKIIVTAPTLVGGNALPYAIDQKESDLNLPQLVAKGIEILDNHNGFFIMAEGGKIDWACHANDAATTMHEVLQFDQAIKAAVDFYKSHPDETLIIVGSDHETGGMSLGFANTKYESDLALLQYQKLSQENFAKIIKEYRKQHPDNWNFKDGLKMLEKYFGFNNSNESMRLSDCEMETLEKAFESSMRGEKDERTKNECTYYHTYGPYEPFAIDACQIIANKAGISWTTYSHTAQPVPLRAIGVGAENFTGYFNNADIGKKLFKLIEKE